MKTSALIAALVLVVGVAALKSPHAGTPAFQYGLTGNAWWAGLSRKTAAADRGGTRTFGYGLTDNDWWAAQNRTRAPRAD